MSSYFVSYFIELRASLSEDMELFNDSMYFGFCAFMKLMLILPVNSSSGSFSILENFSKEAPKLSNAKASLPNIGEHLSITGPERASNLSLR